MFRAGIYARVSTLDQQTLLMQKRTLRRYAAQRGWSVVIEVLEVGSGASERSIIEQIIVAARRRDIDIVLVWRLDRWGRSLVDLVTGRQSVVPLCRTLLGDAMQNDDFLIELTTLEQSLKVSRRCHGRHYPTLGKLCDARLFHCELVIDIRQHFCLV